ncbi:MAG: hypothetical protein AAF481_10600 [Acidobacteriota bacterium]
MEASDLRGYANRSRSSLAEIEAAYWRSRKDRFGAGEGLRIAAELREHVRTVRPDWPTPEDRLADLQAHIRLGELLRSVPTG